ncbi:MAG TPA: PTS sugar transporter subunit IIA [Aquiluna sp.]
MTASLFAPGSIAVIDSAESFSEAIAQSAYLLVTAGHAKAEYVDRVLANFQKLGPYFVVAPGIAIAHAQPAEDVISPGLSLLKLNSPVISGATANDPISLVFSLCTPNSEQHIEMLGEFALLMREQSIVNRLLKASAESVIRQILSR